MSQDPSSPDESYNSLWENYQTEPNADNLMEEIEKLKAERKASSTALQLDDE